MNQELYDEALKAITAFYEDMEISQEDCLDGLERLAAEIEMFTDGLKADIRQKEA